MAAAATRFSPALPVALSLLAFSTGAASQCATNCAEPVSSVNCYRPWRHLQQPTGWRRRSWSCARLGRLQYRNQLSFGERDMQCRRYRAGNLRLDLHGRNCHSAVSSFYESYRLSSMWICWDLSELLSNNVVRRCVHMGRHQQLGANLRFRNQLRAI